MSTIRLILYKGNLGRTKHIALRYYMIRECAKRNNIKTEYLPTSDMIANTLNIYHNRILNLCSPQVY